MSLRERLSIGEKFQDFHARKKLDQSEETAEMVVSQSDLGAKNPEIEAHNRKIFEVWNRVLESGFRVGTDISCHMGRWEGSKYIARIVINRQDMAVAQSIKNVILANFPEMNPTIYEPRRGSNENMYVKFVVDKESVSAKV